MFKFSAVSQIWKKYIQKLDDWDLPLTAGFGACKTVVWILELLYNFKRGEDEIVAEKVNLSIFF